MGFDSSDLTVPLNGSQRFVLMNKDTKQHSIDVDLFSSRFVIVEEKKDKMKISTVLQPQKLLFFKIRDKGFSSRDPEDPYRLDGFVQITVAEDASDKDQENPIPTYYFLPRLTIDLEVKTNKSSSRTRSKRMDFCCESYQNEEANPLDKLIIIKQLESKKEVKTKSTSGEEHDKISSPGLPINDKKSKLSGTTSSITPEDAEEFTPKSIKLKDVIFSDNPQKHSKEKKSSKETVEKKSVIAKEPKSRQLGDVIFPEQPVRTKSISEPVEKEKSKKLEDVVFTDKPKSSHAPLKLKSEDAKKAKPEEGKKKRKKDKKCVIS